MDTIEDSHLTDSITIIKQNHLEQLPRLNIQNSQTLYQLQNCSKFIQNYKDILQQKFSNSDGVNQNDSYSQNISDRILQAYPSQSQEDYSRWKKIDEIIKRIKFKTYIKKFLLQSRKRMFRFLNLQQAKMINDSTYYFGSSQLQIKGKELMLNHKQDNKSCIPKIIRKIIAKFPIFLPNNPILEIWQGIKIMCVIVCYFFYLISFAFNQSIDSILKVELNYGCQICLAIDILVNLNTAIYLKGQLTTSRRCIFQQYRTSKALYFDNIQLIFFIVYTILYYSVNQSSRYLNTLLLPIILKHNDLNIIIKKMKNRFLLQKKAQNAFELISLLKNIFLISHIFACIWILAAKLSVEYEFTNQLNSQKNTSGMSEQKTNWIQFMNIEDESWIVQYIYSYYFITVTMITVGYGDVRPTNTLEVGVCIFLMMTCCLIFGFTINSIGEIFQDIFSKEKNILQKRCVIGNYMERKDINPVTQKQVFEYLEYLLFIFIIGFFSRLDNIIFVFFQ